MNIYKQAQALLFITSMLIFIATCVDQFTETSKIQIVQTGVKTLSIQDGFNYNSRENCQVYVGLQSPNGRMIGNATRQFAICGTGMTDDTQELIGNKILLRDTFKAIHIEKLYLNVKSIATQNFIESNDEHFAIGGTDHHNNMCIIERNNRFRHV